MTVSFQNLVSVSFVKNLFMFFIQFYIELYVFKKIFHELGVFNILITNPLCVANIFSYFDLPFYFLYSGFWWKEILNCIILKYTNLTLYVRGFCISFISSLPSPR